MMIEAQCSSCGGRETIEIDDKWQPLTANWMYFGRDVYDKDWFEHMDCPSTKL